MKCHDVSFEIMGNDNQVVVVELDSQESVIAEAGSMLYLEEGIEFQSMLGDGSEPEEGFFDAMWSSGKRAVSGESLFMTRFTHRGSGKSRVAFTGAFPGQIAAVDMSNLNGDLICHKDSFLAAAMGTNIEIELGGDFLGSGDCTMQRLSGDGKAFINAGGLLIGRDLNNETLRVDIGSIVAFEGSVSYEVESAGDLKSMAFGGEGMFLATLSGTGKVWIQSAPFSKISDKILQEVPTTPVGIAKSKLSGSVLGSVTNILGG